VEGTDEVDNHDDGLAVLVVIATPRVRVSSPVACTQRPWARAHQALQQVMHWADPLSSCCCCRCWVAVLLLHSVLLIACGAAGWWACMAALACLRPPSPAAPPPCDAFDLRHCFVRKPAVEHGRLRRPSCLPQSSRALALAGQSGSAAPRARRNKCCQLCSFHENLAVGVQQAGQLQAVVWKAGHFRKSCVPLAHQPRARCHHQAGTCERTQWRCSGSPCWASGPAVAAARKRSASAGGQRRS
jgi:hypothetical protein